MFLVIDMKRVLLDNNVDIMCFKAEDGGYFVENQFRHQYIEEKYTYARKHNEAVQNGYRQAREAEFRTLAYVEEYDVGVVDQMKIWDDVSASWEALPPLIEYDEVLDKFNIDPVMGDILGDF